MGKSRFSRDTNGHQNKANENNHSRVPNQSAMQMIDQKIAENKWHSKRKLFDDSESDEDEEVKGRHYSAIYLKYIFV